MNYFLTFLLSNALEIPVFLYFFRSVHTWSKKDVLLFLTALNAITHPIVFFLIMNMKLTYLENIFIAEFFAIIAEGLVLTYVTRRKTLHCLAMSFMANIISWQLGPVITFALLKP